MKYNELRIGNLIIGYSGSVETVSSINVNAIKMRNDGDSILLSDCNPIPLTEEWLVRFGFENHANGWMALSICEGYFYIYWERLAGVELSIYKKGVHLNIKYVHQLQNLYFALTGEELKLTDK